MMKLIKKLLGDFTGKISEINKRYEKPRIKMTPLVSNLLFLLRLYLIVIVLILIYKFATTVSLMK